MFILQFAVLAALVAVTLSAPVEEAQSYSSYSSGAVESQGSLSAEGSLEVEAIPETFAQVPVAIEAHHPVQLEHYVSIDLSN